MTPTPWRSESPLLRNEGSFPAPTIALVQFLVTHYYSLTTELRLLVPSQRESTLEIAKELD